MTMRNIYLVLLAGFTMAACAPRMYVKETAGPFPEAMASLQASIEKNGYTLSRIQKVDYGLKKSGYESQKYRVVFFGKPDEIKQLGNAFPQLAPFLPLKVTIRENADGIELVAINPQRLTQLYPDPELRPTFSRWQQDIRNILDDATR